MERRGDKEGMKEMNMLIKKYEKEDMSVCEKYIHCEKCPCFVDEKCVHPYKL